MMRYAYPAAACAALLLAGCGSSTAERRATTTHPSTTPARLTVRLVGPLDVSLPGVRAVRAPLVAPGSEPLVLAAASAASPRAVAAAAARNPGTHYALVGASTQGDKQPNLVGVTYRTDQAARLGGILTGLVAAGQGGNQARVAWVGPGSKAVTRSFSRGVRLAAPGATVLLAPSPSTPARCKEAALAAILDGAVAVMAGEGLCAAAVASAAAEQNRVAASLADFELPDVAVASIVRSALGGSYAGGEDLVFGFRSGAIGVRRLDPRVPSDVAVQVRRAAQHLASGTPVTFD
jgi:basic membrane lipoprotein Med (substrate-binding protein (PBP1-ABC) superfamily)